MSTRPDRASGPVLYLVSPASTPHPQAGPSILLQKAGLDRCSDWERLSRGGWETLGSQGRTRVGISPQADLAQRR